MFTAGLGIIYLLNLGGISHLISIGRKDADRLREVALNWSLAILTGTVLLWVFFDGGGQFQSVIKFGWVGGMTLVFGVDGISLFFLNLTAFLIPICILVSWDSIKFLIKEFLLCLFLIEILLIGVFTVLELVGFYILFEGVLIPMYLIIVVWGTREEKIRASYYFFFYTFLGSVFMLLGIFAVYSETGLTDYRALCNCELGEIVQYSVFLGVFISLAIKIPKIPFHIWLPQAHVEAPVAGSVILAGVLLKIGGYGFIRFTWPLLPEATEYFVPLIMSLSLLGIIYGSLTTCRQVDLKRIIAYSSVAHMGLVTLGIFSHTLQGWVSAVFLMLSHGLVSSALFIVVTFLYERHHTRLIRYYRGMAITMPIFSIIMFLLVLANASVPLSCNFVGEFISLLAAFEYSYIVGIMASSGILVSAAYSIYLYNRVCFGTPSHYLHFPRDLNRREVWALMPLVSLIFLLGVSPNVVMDAIMSTGQMGAVAPDVQG